MGSLRTRLLGATVLVSAGLTMAGNANAQGAPAANPSGGGTVLQDVIVTARKRDETSLSVPVAVSAIPGAQLERRGINSVDGVARLVPSLIIGEGAGTIQGGIVAIRGIAGADSNPMGDQAVSFNIDGVQVARASVRRLSEMDMQQIEVLKGPQALFFGKNSPGGVISVRTGDPTRSLEAKLSTGYEFYAHEIRAEGYVAGPITDTLGFRVAGFFSNLQGWATNVAPQTGPGIFGHSHDRAPETQEYAVRGTLKWDPNERFSARLKLNYSHIYGGSVTDNDQTVHCPLGFAQNNGPVDDCKANNLTTTSNVGPLFGQRDPRFGNGGLWMHQYQMLHGLELNYNLADHLKVTSMTGFYYVNYKNMGNFANNYQETGGFPPAFTGGRGVPGTTLLPSYNFLRIREVTEEARITSSFSGPLNFMFGGLYQASHVDTGSVTGLNALAPVFVNNYRYVQDGTAWSIFGQVLYDILPTLEFAAGARYSQESKDLPNILSGVRPNGTLVNGGFGPQNREEFITPNFERHGDWHNLSPEFTLTWRPTKQLTAYGSYKTGFLAGGFSALAPTPTAHNKYNQQTTKGFEFGVKGLLLDGALRTDLDYYNYKHEGLQVSVTTQGVQQELRNAGSVRTEGVEWSTTYKTPLEGLSLSGSLNWERGRYLDYQAACYRGESSLLCFNQLNRATGLIALVQDLSGTELVRAPTWTGNFGFTYERPVNENLKIDLSANASYSDPYFTDVTNTPGGRQKSYMLVDATLRLAQADDRWDVSVIGRNLGDTYYWVRSSDVPFTGSTPGASPVGILGDTAAVPSRGREVMVRFSYRFGK